MLIDRPADINVGDPQYAIKTAEAEVEGSQVVDISQARAERYVPRTQRNRTFLDIARDPISNVEQDITWWTDGDSEATDAMFFNYLPWFSNCEGYDSHMLISKLLEDHPGCI